MSTVNLRSLDDACMTILTPSQSLFSGGKCSARGGVVQNESRGVVGAERGARRGVLGERRTNQEEHPPEYSIQK